MVRRPVSLKNVSVITKIPVETQKAGQHFRKSLPFHSLLKRLSIILDTPFLINVNKSKYVMYII